MRLELALYSRKCSHQKSYSNAAPQTLPCGAVSQRLRLICNAEQLTLTDVAAATPGRASVSAWTCTPEGEADLADTPFRWVLGRASCVRVAGGRHGAGYQKCTSS